MNWDNVKNISSDDESGRFISVTNVDYIQDTMKSLANKTNSFIIVCSKQKLKNYKDWKIIIQQQINDTDYLALMRRVNYVLIRYITNTEIIIIIGLIGNNIKRKMYAYKTN